MVPNSLWMKARKVYSEEGRLAGRRLAIAILVRGSLLCAKNYLKAPESIVLQHPRGTAYSVEERKVELGHEVWHELLCGPHNP